MSKIEFIKKIQENVRDWEATAVASCIDAVSNFGDDEAMVQARIDLARHRVAKELGNRIIVLTHSGWPSIEEQL